MFHLYCNVFLLENRNAKLKSIMHGTGILVFTIQNDEYCSSSVLVLYVANSIYYLVVALIYAGCA